MNDRAMIGSHCQVISSSSNRFLKAGIYITKSKRAKDRMVAFTRFLFENHPSSLRVYFSLLTENALSSSLVISVANTIVWAPSIFPGKMYLSPMTYEARTAIVIAIDWKIIPRPVSPDKIPW